MADRSPDYIARWLESSLHRFDNPGQFLGTEPGAARKPWDSVDVRWLVAASWPYYHSTGNQSIPAVCATINRNEGFYADRFYLPETPRDLRQLERAGIPVFGIESKHQLRDFDVVGTSISYAVLWLNFCTMLTMSGIPMRRRDREARAGDYPMVVAGGQAGCAPGFMEPVADCIFLGEVEDEPGHGGLSQVNARIAQFKQEGSWHASRIGCYERLAREFNYLFFPRFVEVSYRYEERGLPELSKQVSGYASLLDGMRMPFRSRTVTNLDNIEPLTEAPLLYADPRMGAGDLEVARSCPAWCSFPLRGDEEIITRDGLSRMDAVAGEAVEVWTPAGWRKGLAESHGRHSVQRITFRPADRGTASGAWRRTPRASRRVQVVATPCHGWELVDGTETHGLKVGDIVPSAAADPYRAPAGSEGPDFGLGWVHGFLFGDGHQRKRSTGERRPVGSGSFKVRLFGKDTAARFRFAQFYQPGQNDRSSWALRPKFRVSSIASPEWAKGDAVVYGWADFDLKSWPAESASHDYLAGFMSGWISADGSSRYDGRSYRIAASYLPASHGEISPEQWLEKFAALAGWVYVGRCVSKKVVTNFGLRTAPLVEFTVARPEGHGWCVESIEELSGTPEVYCLTVPDVHRFTLASGITTMNCRLSLTTKPYRERSVKKSVEHAEIWQRNMGSTELSPFSPDFPMHTRKKELLAQLLESVNSSLDVTAMRIDDFNADDQYVLIQARAGADGVSLGLEGVDQRLRDLVGKGTADKDVEDAVARGIRAGFRKFKLFMICNLPGEEAADVMKIAELARRLCQIRDELARPNVVFQFSFTPLLIEAKTPFQWFAPTPPDHTLIKVAEEFRDLNNVQIKIGTKAEPNKVSLFQACQRASRDVGEAITDVFAELGTACWGGVPKDTRERLEAALRRHGFRNGLDDVFDERGRYDLFGHEYIDMGVSPDLLWDVYSRMVEFLEGTDAETYESQFDGPTGGNEWIPRCDQQCQGTACGACSGEDLKLRSVYIRNTDRDIDLARVKVIDQDSVALRVRARIEIPQTPSGRFATREHWKFQIRRAAFRAQHALASPASIAKTTVLLASDACKHTDWACGTDYAEWGMTRRLPQADLKAFVDHMAYEMRDWLSVGDWDVYPAAASVRRDAALALWELEPPAGADEVAARIAAFQAADYVKLVFRSSSAYFAAGSEEVNAKDYVRDLWLARVGHTHKLRMLVSSRVGPYSLYAALAGKPSWIDAAAKPAVRLGIFAPQHGDGDLLRSSCERCGSVIPVGLIGEPYAPYRGYDPYCCPRCADAALGAVVAGLAVRG